MSLSVFEATLVHELIGDGARPWEARRLAALAQTIARQELNIDAHYADSVETLILRERPCRPKLIALPSPRPDKARPPRRLIPSLSFTRRPTQLALWFSAAAALTLIGTLDVAANLSHATVAPAVLRLWSTTDDAPRDVVVARDSGNAPAVAAPTTESRSVTRAARPARRPARAPAIGPPPIERPCSVQADNKTSRVAFTFAKCQRHTNAQSLL